MGYLGLQPPARRVMVRAVRGEAGMVRWIVFPAIYAASVGIFGHHVSADDANGGAERLQTLAANVLQFRLPPGTDFKVTYAELRPEKVCGMVSVRDRIGRLGANRLFLINTSNDVSLIAPDMNIPLASDQDNKERLGILKEILKHCGPR